MGGDERVVLWLEDRKGNPEGLMVAHDYRCAENYAIGWSNYGNVFIFGDKPAGPPPEKNR